jgi:hypothetical protein
MIKLISGEGEHAVYEAEEGISKAEVIKWLYRDDLPQTLSLDWDKGMFYFQTQNERWWFANGLGLYE